MCQCTLFDVGGVEIHSIECIEYCTKDQSNVEDVEDRSNTPKGCNAMYVEDVEDGKRTYKHIFIITFLIWYHLNVMLSMSKKDVEDVKDRSNTPKGCNAMYVEDVEDGKRTYTHILAHNFLNT